MPELAKAYEPQAVEHRLYQKWQDSRAYIADPKSKKPAYSIVIPPPNITGKLTLGHVLNNTIQDILCRRARLQGKEVLWLPGTDHAGLATQNAVEKSIRETEKKKRTDFTREEFVARIWKWKDEYGTIITQQLRRIGISCDWSRERFTLDPDYARAVQEVFVKLYHQGLIKKGRRMVNWCPGSQTAISDEEVVMEKRKGFLYYIRYELVTPQGDLTHIEVATTRPETIPADAALAVNPNGKWKHLIGHDVYRPLRRTPLKIIGDAAVEEGFGTGVLKVTPAHDKVDFEIGLHHHLPIDDILTPDGKIELMTKSEHPGNATRLQGLDRFEARKVAVEILQEEGLLAKAEPYENTVGISERAQVPIEPRLSQQWFLEYPKIAEALKLVQDGHVKFYPNNWAKVYDHWLENIQPWCISRQVWWGHRIPIWQKIENVSNPEAAFIGSYKTPERGLNICCQIESPGAGWEQDPDSLDTWFSSWLWAYETMSEKDGTRAKFYPTSALVTGPDIIFLWVARMLIAGLHFAPNGGPEKFQTEADWLEANLGFKDVYFTGLIRDKQGRKLSKSLGNSPDPIEIIEKYGADGLRFGLVRIAPQGQDIRFDEKQVEEGRNFCNKLWNIARYRTMQGEINPKADPFAPALKRSIFADELLIGLHRLLEGERNVNRALDAYEFSEAACRLYDFVWNEFAATFVEAAKLDFLDPHSPTRVGTLATFDYVMNHVLRLLHPFAPFVTEELWCELGFAPKGKNTIQFETWPTASPIPSTWTARAADLYATADAGRTLRGEVKLASNQKVPFFLEKNPVALATQPLDAEQLNVLASFLNASTIDLLDAPPVEPGPVTFTPLGKLYLPATGLVDPTIERDRLTKELAKVQKDLLSTTSKLADPNMLAKAPPAKLEEWRALEIALREKEAALQANLGKLY